MKKEYKNITYKKTNGRDGKGNLKNITVTRRQLCNIKPINKTKCNHRRKFHIFPKDVWWSYNNIKKGKHIEVEIYGCLDCHQIWCRDYNE